MGKWEGEKRVTEKLNDKTYKKASKPADKWEWKMVAGLHAADRKSLMPAERLKMKRDLCGMMIHLGGCQLFESLQF